jgi:hypothetical protein
VRRAVFLTGLLLVVGCDHPGKDVTVSAPQSFALRLPTPDATYKLTPAERASIRPGFDVDALERMLAAVDPQARPIILGSFQFPKPGEPARHMYKVGDPALTPLLDEVWAPMWDHFAPDAIEREDFPYPGRELARERRAAARAKESKQP